MLARCCGIKWFHDVPAYSLVATIKVKWSFRPIERTLKLTRVSRICTDQGQNLRLRQAVGYGKAMTRETKSTPVSKCKHSPVQSHTAAPVPQFREERRLPKITTCFLSCYIIPFQLIALRTMQAMSGFLMYWNKVVAKHGWVYTEHGLSPSYWPWFVQALSTWSPWLLLYRQMDL